MKKTDIKKKLSILLTAIIAIGISIGIAYAQVGVHSITMSDGLLSNSVRCITQDAQGFLWFASDNGLCRYDGMNVKPYHIDELGDEQYISTVFTSDKSLWVGTNRGVYCLNTATEKFTQLSPKMKSEVRSITMDCDNTLWMVTASDGVFKEEKEAGRVENVNFAGTPKGKRFPNINTIYVDKENQIWAMSITDAPYLWRLNKSNGTFAPYKTIGALTDICAHSMIETQDGNHYIGSWTKGLLKLNADGSVSKIADYHHIHCLYEISSNHILIGCDDGLKEYSPTPFISSLNGNATTINGSINPINGTTANDISTKFVYSITSDAEGGIWYSTFYGGVNYVSPLGDYFKFYNSSNTTGMHGQIISHFCEDPNGRIWIGSDDGGLGCYTPSTNTYISTPLPNISTAGKNANVHALCLDGNDLWIGTYTSGIYIKNIQSGAVRKLTGPTVPASCYAIFLDSKKNIWLSTMTGIMRYDRQTQQFHNIKELKSISVDIDEDKNGRLWFSTQVNNLWSYNTRTNKWKQYTLPSGQVNCVNITPEGKLYAATGDGLFVYNNRKDSFENIHFDCTAKNILGIVETQGYIWVSSDQGIIKYSKADGIQCYNRYDGLISEQFQPNSALLASDGRVYFGSIKGFCAFYPYQVKTNNNKPNVFITGLEIFNKKVEVGSDQLPMALTDIDQLDLYSSDEMFSLTFAALSYCSPKKNQYAYRLEGFDKEWIYVGANNKATYTNLPAGTYTFHVKATNNDGIWGAKEATLKIVVHPPFWWSLPAKLIYLLLFGAGIYFYIHERLRRANIKHEQEMALLKEKQEQEVQKARLAFFTMIAHEIRTPVSLIIAPLEQLLKNRYTLEEPKDSTQGKLLSVIDRNAHRLLDLVNQLLDFNKMQHRDLEMHFKETNINELMHSVTERFTPFFEEKGNHFEVEYPDENFTAAINAEGITKVISNLLTNANKYTKDFIRLSCITETIPATDTKPEQKSFTITVEDNGIGISKDEQGKIFDAFYQARDNKPGTGIGLNIVKSIVTLHHGNVHVESEPGQGSKFIVEIKSITPNTETDATQLAVNAETNNITVEGVKDTMTADDSTVGNGENIPLTMPDSNMKILIVEDNPDMLEFLSANLAAANYDILTAENGREAIDVIHHNQVNLIVSDWMMPEMDGAALCRRIRSNVNTSHIPFIMLTAKTDDESKTESMMCGADAYIEKPFSVKYLEACIHNMIDMRKRLFKRFSGTPDAPITEITSNTVDDGFMKKMNDIIEENINNPKLNINLLADKLCISRSGLFSKIKSISGTTPNEMIQVLRMKKAAQLLATKQYRINEVCYMVGYSNPSYFAKCFSKQFGKKPAEFIAES